MNLEVYVFLGGRSVFFCRSCNRVIEPRSIRHWSALFDAIVWCEPGEPVPASCLWPIRAKAPLIEEAIRAVAIPSGEVIIPSGTVAANRLGLTELAVG